jgi:predicted RNase H-like nuclease (RuvC/YqgF family)
MQVTAWLKAPVMVAAVCLTALPVFGQQQPSGDPVADAARKAREQQKKEAKPKKVYTEDDLSRGKSGSSDQSQSAGSTGQQSAESTPQNTEAGGTGGDNAAQTDEKKWRKRFQDLRDKIARSEEELDVLQRELNKAQVQYYPDPQKALMEQNQRKDINEKTSKIDAKKKEIEQLKQSFSDLEDDLRKSGGDPGWSRE